MPLDFSLFEDVDPIPQDDGPRPAVPIAYTDEFTKVHDIFRAILAKDERSERALLVTAAVIELNAANYTAWHFRRHCLRALKSDLSAELAYVSARAEESPKNYQIWHHRRAVVEDLGDSSKEKDFTAMVFEEDAKNYHAWAHRQWALEHFSIWEGELKYCEELLCKDLRNNSAWNQRWFVVSRTEDLTLAVREREVRFALSLMKLAPNNECPYNYLRGWIQDDVRFSNMPFIKQELLELRGNEDPKMADAPPLLGLMVDVYEDEGDITSAAAICTQLADDIDVVRAKYWRWRREAMENPGAGADADEAAPGGALRTAQEIARAKISASGQGA